MQTKLYSALANLLSAHACCVATGNKDAATLHYGRITELVRNNMPSGSGFDNGTTLDLEASSADKLVFDTSFHHMDESGYYDGWTEHRIYVTPSLIHGVELRITGKDRNQIKDYIHDAFSSALKAEVEL